MARQPGSPHGGHHSNPPGKSPRFRLNREVELRKQEQATNAKKRKPRMAGSVNELFHPTRK